MFSGCVQLLETFANMIFRPTIAAEPTATACSGKSYAIQASDDCYSISKSQGIGTGWLLNDNQLQAYCAEFPTSGNLCLTNTCRVYIVQTNDTCKSIAAAHNVTIPQVVAWNPVSVDISLIKHAPIDST